MEKSTDYFNDYITNVTVTEFQYPENQTPKTYENISQLNQSTLSRRGDSRNTSIVGFTNLNPASRAHTRYLDWRKIPNNTPIGVFTNDILLIGMTEKWCLRTLLICDVVDVQ